jgi:MFS family permease
MTEPLSSAERARGRRLAISSHPAGMTFYMVFTQQLPTLALVHLGASEAAIGLQTAFIFGFQLLQLPVLRAVARVAKRRILVIGQVMAVLGALPLVFFEQLAGGQHPVAVALASFALVAVGLNVAQTVWFPMLRGFVEPEAIGRFFGTLRTGWHLALIVYYVAAQRWLAAHPGSFGPLFLAGFLFGALRIAMIARLPERSERTGERIRVREALALVRDHADLRRYLAGTIAFRAVFWSVVPFAVVMLKREVGFSEEAILLTTVAWYAGGLLTLYLWGRIVDRVGPRPIFRWTSIGMGVLILTLTLVEEPGTATLVGVILFFAGVYALAAGFAVADIHVLFRLTPPDAPARMLVVAQVSSHVLGGLPPIAVGLLLENALEGATSRLAVYDTFFAIAAVLQALAFLPLRRFR